MLLVQFLERKLHTKFDVEMNYGFFDSLHKALVVRGGEL